MWIMKTLKVAWNYLKFAVVGIQFMPLAAKRPWFGSQCTVHSITIVTMNAMNVKLAGHSHSYSYSYLLRVVAVTMLCARVSAEAFLLCHLTSAATFPWPETMRHFRSL